MLSKRFQSTYILLVLFLVLFVLVVFYFNDDASQKRKESLFEKPLLSSSQIASVSKVSFQNPESDPIELSLDADSWKVNGYSSDPDLSSALLASLEALPYGKVVSQNSDNWGQYDLTDESASILRLYRNDVETEVYYFGKPDTSSSFHMRRNDDKRVFLVDSDILKYASYDLSRWRDKRVFPFAYQDVQRMSVRVGEEKWDFVHDGDDWSRITEAGTIALPDVSAFDRYLALFWNIKASEILDDDSLFESADNAVFVLLKDDREYVVAIDSRDEGNYARVTDRQGLLRLPTDLSAEIRPNFLTETVSETETVPENTDGE